MTSFGGNGIDKPATGLSWYEALWFINWLNTSTGNAPAYKFDGGGNFLLWESSDAGYDATNRYRNTLAKYFLPSVHEWYKAAYHDPTTGAYFDYPTGSDTAPTPVTSGTAANTAVYQRSASTGPANITFAGGLSAYGTMGQGGNLREWEETDTDLMNDGGTSNRGVRGGMWNGFVNELRGSMRLTSHPSVESTIIGFRVASTAEFTGDFNGDGTVDAADYVTWRKGLGTTYAQDDFNEWRANFGATLGSGAGGSDHATSPIVPEPENILLLVGAAVMYFPARQFRAELLKPINVGQYVDNSPSRLRIAFSLFRLRPTHSGRILSATAGGGVSAGESTSPNTAPEPAVRCLFYWLFFLGGVPVGGEKGLVGQKFLASTLDLSKIGLSLGSRRPTWPADNPSIAIAEILSTHTHLTPWGISSCARRRRTGLGFCFFSAALRSYWWERTPTQSLGTAR
jgi:hypothetical protein